MWVARDKNGTLTLWVNEYPKRKYGIWIALDEDDYEYWGVTIDNNLFPNLTWEDEPIEVGFVKLCTTEKMDYIDLDLPSGTLWANMNVGANSPEEYGEYLKFDEAQKYSLPTMEQIKELINDCKWGWTTMNGKKGYKVSSKKDSSKYIFLPAAGYRLNGSLYLDGKNGYYWSDSLGETCSDFAYFLNFYSRDVDWFYSYLYFSRSVRTVKNK